MNSKLKEEEQFHDNWANSENLTNIDVIKFNEVCTSPEIRHITKVIEPLKDKSLLDIGCGLGEASVYFSLKGAKVTSLDLSSGMLDAASKLAELNNTKIRTHKANAEDFLLDENDKFDVIYVGNLFHHVDIDSTLKKIIKHLKPNGILVSWDPVAYNPIINIYRKFATQVRTIDEHPFTLKDIKIFNNYFGNVEKKWYWFSTLIIFLIMFFVQKRNPNEERYWKKVVVEADKWKYIYLPLELADRLLLKIFPFLRPLCWNVVIIASKPKLSELK